MTYRADLVEQIARRVEAVTSRPCGRGDLPSGDHDLDANGNPVRPYVLLQLIAGGGRRRKVSGYESTTIVVQFTVVGDDMEGALYVADRVDLHLQDRTATGAHALLQAAGIPVMGIEAQAGSPGGVERSGSLWLAIDRFEFTVEA